MGRSSVQGVLIDLDGTLVDTLPDFHAALNAMRADLNLMPVAIEQVRTWIGKGSERLVAEALEDVAGAAERERLYPTALSIYLQYYERFNGTLSGLYPGAMAALQDLAAMALPLACVTNKPQDFAVAALRHFGLLEYFQHVQGSAAGSPKKPDPYPIIKACTVLSIEPSKAVVIGDSINDVTAAHAAGCKVLLLPYGYNHGLPVGNSGADAIVESLGAAVHWIVGATGLAQTQSR